MLGIKRLTRDESLTIGLCSFDSFGLHEEDKDD